MAQLATVHDNHIYTVERANSSKVPWLVVGPGGVCSVAHKLSVAPVYTCNNDSKHGKQLLVRLATALVLLLPTYAQDCARQGVRKVHFHTQVSHDILELLPLTVFRL